MTSFAQGTHRSCNQRVRIDRNPYPNPVHNPSHPELKFNIQSIIRTNFQIHIESIYISKIHTVFQNPYGFPNPCDYKNPFGCSYTTYRFLGPNVWFIFISYFNSCIIFLFKFRCTKNILIPMIHITIYLYGFSNGFDIFSILIPKSINS